MLATYFRNIKSSTRIKSHLEKLVADPKDEAEAAVHRRRLRQWVAVVTIQAGFRGSLDRKRVVRRRHLVVVAQCTIRRWRARCAVQWKRLFRAHKARRVRERAWTENRRLWQRSATLEEQLMIMRLFVHSEMMRVEEEMQTEQKRFEKGWKCFNRDMSKYFLTKKRLAECWVEQTDSATYRITYFNTATGESQEEHPHIHIVRARRKQERSRGLAMLRERLSILEGYKVHLRAGEERELKQLHFQIEKLAQSSYQHNAFLLFQ